MKARIIIPLYITLIFVVSCGKGGDEPITSPSIPIETTPRAPDPGKVSLSLPNNNEVCYDGVEDGNLNSLVNFSWQSSADTDSYELVVVNQATNRTRIESGITTTSKELSLEKETSYSWRVVSRSSGTVVTNSSDTWQFYLQGDGQENHAPFPATLLSPRSGSTVTSTDTVSLVWEGNDPDQGDTLVYTVYFDTVDGLQDQTNSEYTNISTTSVAVNIERESIYYWRIKTSDGISSSFSQVYSFRTN